MPDPDDMRDQKQVARLRKLMPALALGMSVVTFFAINAAGHAPRTSLLVAAAMFVFVYGTFKMREAFGAKGFILVLLALSLFGVLVQRAGWL